MNKSLILNKIKKANNLSTDTELAKFLGISKNTLSNWRGRDTLDWELVLSKCDILDLNWLIKDEIDEVIRLDERKNNSVEKEVKSPEINIEGSNDTTLNVVMDMYKNLAIDYGSLQKEHEILKKNVDTPDSTTSAKK
jgi:transcriptional regulator with XRE-family HTH domain